MERHCWYLDETLVPLALLDPQFPDVEQENIAKTFSKPVQNSEKSNVFKDLHFKQETPPGLAPLIEENSWFTFKKKMEDKLWLNTPASMWCFVDQFKKFPTLSIVWKLLTAALKELVKLVSEFMNNIYNEEDQQKLLHSV